MPLTGGGMADGFFPAEFEGFRLTAILKRVAFTFLML